MSKQVRSYTKIGKRISALGKRQRSIALVLGLSQQTVSRKLRGETAILVSDLEKLAEHYKVPITYFFEDESGRPELAAAWERIRKGRGPARELVVLLDGLSSGDVARILELARAWSQKRAAEDAPPYGRR